MSHSILAEHASAASRSLGLGRVKKSPHPSFMMLLVGLSVVLAGCGKAGSDVCPSSSESCDPLPGDPSATPRGWSAAGSTATFRLYHTATLLQNGKVLVVGGANGLEQEDLSSTAELYDPATRTWSSTGKLVKGRMSHTATLLPNGKVLVVGGGRTRPEPSPAPRLPAELYDPATGSWTVTGSPAEDHIFHTATLLPNGKVLVVGGGTLAELYDPATGSWSLTASPLRGRGRHMAVLLPNGKVLVSGGLDLANSAEVYDPETGTWALTGQPSKARHDHTATVLSDGKVLVVGGSTLGGIPFNVTTELYDPATGTWSATGNLTVGRALHTATLLSDGKVLVSGGNGSTNQALTSAEVYDPAAGTWEPTANLALARAIHSSTRLPSGQVLVIGGTGYPETELYTP
jgi:hypothetical protein